jgi:hypothetical protein
VLTQTLRPLLGKVLGAFLKILYREIEDALHLCLDS